MGSPAVYESSRESVMSTKSITLMRSAFGKALAFLLAGAGLCAVATAQAPAAVVSTSTAAFAHTGPYGGPWQTAFSTRGDFLLLDFANGGLYEFPANGSAAITLAAPNQYFGGYDNSGIAVDPRNNNIYIDDNYNNGLLEFPYDTATQSWDIPPVQVATNIGGNLGGSCGNYFQSAGLAMNASGLMAVATENGCGVEIFTVPVDTSGNFGAAVPVDTNMTSRARTLAMDNAGNIYFTEDSGLKGAYYLAAGTSTNADAAAVRIDPNLGSVIGVVVDGLGNLYVDDQSAGVFLVPLQAGVPVPANAVQLTPAPADASSSIDLAHGVLGVPVSSWNGYSDAVKVYLNRLEMGSAAVGSTSATPGTVTYSFSAAETPASFQIDESGVASTDFAVATGGTCTAGTAASAQSTCTVLVNFTPHEAGDVSARLLMLDAKMNVLAITLLHGSGQASAVQVIPGAESKLATGLKTPSQVATDASGATYVADSGSGKVTLYPVGASPTPVGLGTGLTAPTGVAVDGSGDVFIADSGSVYEVPVGAAGLNAAGQVKLKGGLGTKLKLAVDGEGNLYVADPDNQRVVKLSNLAIAAVSGLVETDFTGFSQLTAIADDGSGDLYLANGSNLVEISALGTQTTLLSTLGSATGLAIDPTGSVYLTATSGTVRIPNESGKLNPPDEIEIATDVSNPTSIALDKSGGLHLTDAAGEVVLVSASASFNFGTLSTTTSTAAQTFTILNEGNLPLTISGFAGTTDFSETATTCSGPLASGASCAVTITFSPGPGDQGTLSGSVLVTGNEANTPVGINVVGVGAPLAPSTTTDKVTTPTVDGASTAITVTPSTGTSPTPTGTVTLTITGNGIKTVTMTGTLTNGTVTLNPTNLPAGTYIFVVSYQGDRAYSGSKASTSVTVAAGAVTLVQPTIAQVQAVDLGYPYVLSGSTGSDEPSDGSVTTLEYTYPVSVVPTDGGPLIGVLSGKTVNYGSVLYEVNGAVLSDCPAVPVSGNGMANFNTSCLPIDTSNNTIPDIMTTYMITPVYVPAGVNTNVTTDPNYLTVTGTPITFTALRNPMVVISSNPSSLSVSAGSTTTAALTLTSLLGYGTAGAGGQYVNYTLPVDLTCDGLPAYASCSFSYPKPDPSDATSVDVTPTTPGMVIMTINTNVPPGVVASLHRGPGETSFAAVFGLGLLGLIVGRRKSLRLRIPSLLCLLLCAGVVASIGGCSSQQLVETGGTTTPAGTYTVSVTARQVGSLVIPPSTPSGLPVTAYGQANQMSLPFTISVTVK